MLGFRVVTALADKTISHGVEMVSKRRKMRADVFDVVDDSDIASILEKAHESADATHILRTGELLWAVTRAAAAVTCEATYDRIVHAGQGNTTSREPT